MNERFVRFDDHFDLDVIFDRIYTKDIDQRVYFRIDRIYLKLLSVFEVLNVIQMIHLMWYRCILTYLVDDPIGKDVVENYHPMKMRLSLDSN